MVNFLSQLTKCLTVLLCSSLVATALPLDEEFLGRNGTHLFAAYPKLNIVKPRQDDPLREIRILPLGASIISGQGSLNNVRPSGAGYVQIPVFSPLCQLN
jgi:hypothetical protein